jgi:twitching motility protein PilT
MIEELLRYAIENNASDIHITVGMPPTARINGNLMPISRERLNTSHTQAMVEEILSREHLEEYKKNGEIDLSYSVKGLGRFRVNIYRQRGSSSLALRVVALHIPSIGELGLPDSVKELSRKTRGLVLVTGSSGSGKSTTLAAMIDLINKERTCHVLTLEDPIEYLHRHNKSIVNQREIGYDSKNFAAGLRSALRQDPDVILVGEMRDLETISTAITAAETGHLVLSTLHTIGADKTIDRIIDVFPPHQQQQIRVQLSTVLQGVISQHLLLRKDGKGRVPAVEVMVATPAIRNLIREGKTHQLMTSIQTGRKYGMQSMDAALSRLYMEDIISHENALLHCTNEEVFRRLADS